MAVLAVGVLFFLAFAAAVFLLFKKQESSQGALQEALSLDTRLNALKETLQGEMKEMQQQLRESLVASTRMVSENSKGYADTVGQVQRRLGELQQATQTMIGIGKDISSLQSILQSPKLRGGMGEFLLAELLRQILPEDYFVLQYTFAAGTKVDAVVRTGDSLIPVDAKFPLENFRRMAEAPDAESAAPFKKEFIRDVKKHIDSIASKYILPEEKTMDFALMYIPAESVYYEVILKWENEAESLAAYAHKKRVVPVSPNSFYSYLMVVAQGLRGMKIEKSARNILNALAQLENDFAKCVDEFEKIGTHLNHAQSSYKTTEKRMEKLQSHLSRMDQLSGDAPAGLPLSSPEPSDLFPGK